MKLHKTVVVKARTIGETMIISIPVDLDSGIKPGDFVLLENSGQSYIKIWKRYKIVPDEGDQSCMKI